MSMATEAYLHPRPVAKRLRRYTRSCLYWLVYSSNGLFYRASLVIRLSSSRIRDRPRPFAGPSRVGCGLTVNVHCRAVPRSWQLRTRPRIAFHEGHPSTRALADLADHRGCSSCNATRSCECRGNDYKEYECTRDICWLWNARDVETRRQFETEQRVRLRSILA